MNRRNFLKKTTFLSSGLLLTNTLFAKGSDSIRFGIVTDSHYADRPSLPNRSRYYRDSLDKMTAFSDVMNQENVDFVIHLGDFKDEDPVPNHENTLKYLKDLEQEFTKFRGDTYHVLGNHDVDSITKKEFLDNVTNTGIHKEKSYYSFDKNGFHFVVLDACFNEDQSSYAPGNFSWDQAYVPKKQLIWLENDLKNTKLPSMIFSHQLLFDIEDSKPTIRNASELRGILENSKKVLSTFHGHVHKEFLFDINGVNYCSFNGMVDKPELSGSSFVIVECTKNKGIKIESFYNASNRQISF